MSDAELNSYDRVPYDARPRAATHPDTLATVATLMGMTPAPVDRCRLLELGCATGGNLFPLAEALPNAQIVGIDLSPKQIETGRKVAAILGLKNLRLEAMSILDVDASLGQFDYIVCHGVYSWVPEPVREKIMQICKGLLAPQGVAYVSYNTYPGWHLRAGVRDLMNFHVYGLEDPQQKVQQARSILDFFSQQHPVPDSTWVRVMKDEAEIIRPTGDYYVYHEHLEDDNRPLYFYQFMNHAHAHGLQYLGEATAHTTLSVYSPELQEGLRKLAPDLLNLEQYLDFLRNRTFRSTLLVHDELNLVRNPKPEIIKRLLIAGASRPVSEKPELATAKVEEFVNSDGSTVSTNVPFAKAALLILFENWPRAYTFDELGAAVRERLGGATPVMPEEQAEAMLAQSLVHLFLSNLTNLHTYLPAHVAEVSDRPTTTTLMRIQAATGAGVANRRHKEVTMSVFDRAVLSLCDGSRDHAGLIEGLAEKVKAGDVELKRDDRTLAADDEVRAALKEELGPSLARLARAMLLVA